MCCEFFEFRYVSYEAQIIKKKNPTLIYKKSSFLYKIINVSTSKKKLNELLTVNIMISSGNTK